ncbi:MAG: Tetratricopeptide repeat protein [Planctomycetaceae bacterium]|nr:Tetratricopeptide repeat protein [Planctomycetaceae bacterium]
MLRCLQLFLLGLCAIVMEDAPGPLYAQGAYPRVMSPTGHFYGPTQAHYQYERQYGQPWYGGPPQFDPNTGNRLNGHGHHGGGGFHVGGLPYGGYGYGIPAYGGYGYAAFYQNQFGYAPIQQYQTIGPRGPQGMLPMFGPAPTFSWQLPGPFQQPLVQQPQGRPQAFPIGPQPGNAGPVIPAVAPEPVMAKPHNFLPQQPSSVAQRQRSLHLQGQGDIWFRQQNYLQAYSRYKQAAGAAPDLAAPRFRMAYALMSLQRYELAVPEFQRGIKLDPQYPLTGESPQKIYGEDNRIAAAALPQAVAAWVRQDIRSSDRLFLLGALLMISGDHVRARTLLETAAEFGAEGPTEHIVAFLRLDNPAEAVPQQPAVNGNAPNDDDRPPVPEEVEKMLRENKNWLPPIAPQGKPAIGPEVPKPQRQPVPPAKVEPAVPAVPIANPEPVAATPKAVEAASGYQPIPKKGTAPQPQPAEKSQPEVQPAGQQDSDKKSDDSESGPVIPIPGAAKP